MDKLWFFLLDSVWNMAGLLIILLSVVQLGEWALGKRLPVFSGKMKLLIAFVALQWGQFKAFETKNTDIANMHKVITTSGDQLLLTQDQLRQRDEALRSRPIQSAPPQINVQVPP